MLARAMRAALLVVASAAAITTIAASQPATAEGPPDPPIQVAPGPGNTSPIGIGVHNYPLPPEPGAPEGTGSTGGGGNGGGADDICGDPTHSAICAAFIRQQKCAIINETFAYSNVTDPARMIPILTANGCAPVGAGGAVPLPPTPGELAQAAYNQLRLPSPMLERSPPASNSYNGVPFTWLNIWTWFWTSPASYAPASKSATVPGVSATVVARPSALVFDPGDGSAPVTCAGPGRAWTVADGNAAPPGGCGFTYRHTSNGSVLTTTLTIRWDVTWTGTGGAGGVFNGMTTQVTGPLQVLDVQVVNTGR